MPRFYGRMPPLDPSSRRSLYIHTFILLAVRITQVFVETQSKALTVGVKVVFIVTLVSFVRLILENIKKEKVRRELEMTHD